MPITLRPATVEDFEAVARILAETRQQFMQYAPSVHTPADVENWVRKSLIPAGGVTLAVQDEGVVGLVACSHDPPHSWINQMGVSPSLVGHGIGTELLAHALRTLALPIRLFTFQQNHGARRFYERNAFRAVQFSDGQANEEHCPDVLYEFP
jgi:GNAT superfamily N-acetyltransferase